MPAKTKAVAYLRVSTDKQADTGVSLDAQRAKVQLYAELYDLELVEVVVDAGASAKTLERDGLQRALAMLDNGKADALLVAKLDRLTRSVRDLGALLDGWFGRKDGPALLSVQEQVDTRTAGGRLVLNVLMSVAQWERETIGERTSAAMAHMKAEGAYTGGRAPYGWQADENGKLHPVKAEQEAISLAKRLHANGNSLRRVGALLSEAGYCPRNGSVWHGSSIRIVLAAKTADVSVEAA
jgi:DNA invertase Pin-like site-specific DNA recombinase